MINRQKHALKLLSKRYLLTKAISNINCVLGQSLHAD